MSEGASKFGLFDPLHPLAHIGKKIFIALTVLIGVIVYYVIRYSKGVEIIKTLAEAAPLLLIALFAVEAFYLILQGNFLKQIYAVLGIKRSMQYLSLMYLGMNLVNTVAPLVGLSGSIYMMHLEKKNNLARSDTLIINFLYYITDYLVFLIVLMIGLTYLLFTGDITRTIILTSLIFACFVLLVLIFGMLIFTHPFAMQKILRWINHALSRILFRKKKLLDEEDIEKFSNGARNTWSRIKNTWPMLIKASFLALGFHVCCLLLLWISFKTFNQDSSLQVLIAGYTVGTLLNIVSITPSGIGFAEGGMTAVFAALGIPVENALLVTLLYRAFFVWYPLSLGVISIQLLPNLASKEIGDNL